MLGGHIRFPVELALSIYEHTLQQSGSPGAEKIDEERAAASYFAVTGAGELVGGRAVASHQDESRRRPAVNSPPYRGSGMV
jgi:hypothetical protein